MPILMPILIVGLSIFATGLFFLFAKDAAWHFQVWSNRNRGVVSKRTAQWDAATTSQGIILIVCGLLLVGALTPEFGRPLRTGQLSEDGHNAQYRV